jgi:hypothetical protein
MRTTWSFPRITCSTGYGYCVASVPFPCLPFVVHEYTILALRKVFKIIQNEVKHRRKQTSQSWGPRPLSLEGFLLWLNMAQRLVGHFHTFSLCYPLILSTIYISPPDWHNHFGTPANQLSGWWWPWTNPGDSWFKFELLVSWFEAWLCHRASRVSCSWHPAASARQVLCEGVSDFKHVQKGQEKGSIFPLQSNSAQLFSLPFFPSPIRSPTCLSSIILEGIAVGLHTEGTTLASLWWFSSLHCCRTWSTRI